MPSTRVFARLKSFLALGSAARLVIAFVVGGISMTFLTERLSRPPAEPRLEVASLIRAVKEQLAAAESDRIQKKELPIFELNTLEMEIHFVARSSGGVKAEVVGIGTSLDAGAERVQTLKLHWTVIPPKEKSVAPSLTDESESGKADDVIEVPASRKK